MLDNTNVTYRSKAKHGFCGAADFQGITREIEIHGGYAFCFSESRLYFEAVLNR